MLRSQLTIALHLANYSGLYIFAFQAKFLFMVRDGRATVNSIISRKVTITGFDLTSYRQCMVKWNSAIETMHKQCKEIGSDKCMMVSTRVHSCGVYIQDIIMTNAPQTLTTYNVRLCYSVSLLNFHLALLNVQYITQCIHPQVIALFGLCILVLQYVA